MIALLTNYLPLLLLTLLLELAIIAAAFRGADRRLAVLGAVAVNLFTHPLAVLAARSAAVDWLAIELAVVLVEVLAFVVLLRLPPPRSVVAVLVANAVSAAAGMVLTAALFA